MRAVKKERKRRCPNCGSNKWEWIGAVPTTLELLQRYLLVKYKCEKCSEEFLVEEGVRSRYVDNHKRCYHCNSKNVEKLSSENADIRLYRCRQCNAYMTIEK